MAQSAMCTYATSQVGNDYNYQVTLSNTSDDSFDIYSFMFGLQYNVTVVRNFPLQDVVIISTPPGWQGHFMQDVGITFQTNYQGSPSASGYIFPGQSGTFSFQSSTPPPGPIKFGCCYHDEANFWGFCTNGDASNRPLVHKPPYYAHINPLVLLLGDELFARLNLPRPPFDGPGLRTQLAAGIRSMTPAQREVAARTIDSYIAALTTVRAELKQVEG